ncbi:MAG: transposase [Endomicrobiales bacterium]
MTRPLRINYVGAVYHITSRGNERQKIFRTDEDRLRFLALLGEVAGRYRWLCHSYCLMDNHYHLLVETPLGNISGGMRQLNGVYTQYFNRTHKRAGHLFQGRFKGIIVEKGSHLLELCRYIVLNPVRAKISSNAEGYHWSNYRAFVGAEQVPSFLNARWILSQFGKTGQAAAKAFAVFVNEGAGDRPWERLIGQIYFGSEDFIRCLEKAGANQQEIPRAHRKPLRPSLSEILDQANGIKIAYSEHGYRMKEIADFLGIHYATVSRRLKRLEEHTV